MTISSRLQQRIDRNSDAGFIFMAALLIFVLLSATTIVIVAAASNQTTQTRANRQNIQSRTNITLAENDALLQLNTAGYADTPSFTWRTAATNKWGVNADDKTTWNWYFDSATKTVNAASQVTGSAKTRTEKIDVDYSDVASYRLGADNLPIYSVSALGAFKDAVSVSSDLPSSDSVVTTNGTLGMYGLSKFPATNTLNGTGGGVVVAHDDRSLAGLPTSPTTTSRRDGITSTVDERVAAEFAASKCPVDSWQPALTGGSLTADSTVQCYNGLNVDAASTLTVLGTGVKTIVVRGTSATYFHSLAGALANPNLGQLHIIFVKGNSWDHPLVLGNATMASNLKGLYAYAPKLECRTGAVKPVITGSVACSKLTAFTATVNWEEPKIPGAGTTSRRVWYTKR
jgi:hypothetical protein